MRKAKLTVKQDKASTKWIIEGYYPNGKRSRPSFDTKEGAENRIKEIQLLQKRIGLESQHLPTEALLDAVAARKILAEFGITLTAAANYYASHQEQAGRSKLVKDALEDYLVHRKRLNLRERSLNDVRFRMLKFSATYGDTLVSSLSTKDVENWIHSIGKLSAQTLNSYRTILNAFFNFCINQGYIAANPAKKVAKVKIERNPPAIFKANDLARLLEALPEYMIPKIAIGAFAGIRTEEIFKLTWENVNFDKGLIEVPVISAKTASRRFVKILPALESWLAPHKKSKGSIWPHSSVTWYRDFEEIRKKAKIKTWPKNVLRHSFASYHLAYFERLDELTLQMGHNSSVVLFNNYRELVSKEDAAAYWNLTRASVKKSLPGN